MKLKDYELYSEDAIKIFREIEQKKENFYFEACFELATLYSSVSKNFNESKRLFQVCVDNNFQKKHSIKHLELLQKLTMNLDREETDLLESCSDARNYELIKFLAKSSGPVIFLVKQKSTSKEFVLKRFPIGVDLDFNETLKEVLYLMKLKNQHVCEIIDFYVEENPDEDDESTPYFFCLIMPYYKSDLFKFITSKNFDPLLSMKKISEFILELCYGLDYIHSKNIIHRDLKPGTPPIF
jgi:hypothetical protein